MPPTSSVPALPTHRCVVCRAPAIMDREPRRLPCGHYGYVSDVNGHDCVVGWVDTVAMTLNLARAAGEPVSGRWERVRQLERVATE